METLGQAFQPWQTAPVDLPSVRYVRLGFSCLWLYWLFLITEVICTQNRMKKEHQPYLGNLRSGPRIK
jgi:hypothetical protein